MKQPMLFLLPTLLAVMTASAGGKAADSTAASCLAANENSIKLRAQHELRAARAQLLACAAVSCPVDIRNECARRVDEVGRAIPVIVFEAKAADGSDLVSVKVTMDGKALVDRLDGTAIALDPGEHRFVFEIPNQRPVEKVLVLREGEKARHERITFGTAAAAAEGSTSPPATPSTPRSRSAQATLGLVTAGVGVAALATGAVFGMLASQAKSDYEKHCASAIGAPPGFCDGTGIDGHDDASKKATLSTIFFVGGGVAGAAGLLLFLTGTKGSTSTQVGLAPGRIYVEGRF